MTEGAIDSNNTGSPAWLHEGGDTWARACPARDWECDNTARWTVPEVAFGRS